LQEIVNEYLAPPDTRTTRGRRCKKRAARAENRTQRAHFWFGRGGEGDRDPERRSRTQLVGNQQFGGEALLPEALRDGATTGEALQAIVDLDLASKNLKGNKVAQCARQTTAQMINVHPEISTSRVCTMATKRKSGSVLSRVESGPIRPARENSQEEDIYRTFQLRLHNKTST
jgi:hypothetical protein